MVEDAVSGIGRKVGIGFRCRFLEPRRTRMELYPRSLLSNGT